MLLVPWFVREGEKLAGEGGFQTTTLAFLFLCSIVLGFRLYLESSVAGQVFKKSHLLLLFPLYNVPS
jgi:hypothetical protein